MSAYHFTPLQRGILVQLRQTPMRTGQIVARLMEEGIEEQRARSEVWSLVELGMLQPTSDWRLRVVEGQVVEGRG